jgi:hypothetical protein
MERVGEIDRERERDRERESKSKRGGPVGQQAGYLRLALEEIESRDRDRDIETRETHKLRDRADNKNPEQSWVAQLVLNKKQGLLITALLN